LFILAALRAAKMNKNRSARAARGTIFGGRRVHMEKRQFDVGLISAFGPREARPKRRKIVPRTERFFAPVEFTY
jgi:hypothetical protein